MSKKVSIRIAGMTCVMCVKAIEKSLKALPGVTSAEVNLATEKALVIYEPQSVSPLDMKKAVEEAGYNYLGVEGEEPSNGEDRAREEELRAKRNRFVVGFLVGLPLMFLDHIPLNIPFSKAYLAMVIATPAFFYVSLPVFRAALHSLRNRILNMDVMYAMGIGVAYTSSVLGTFQIVLTRDFLFYDTAVMLAAFLTVGRYLEARAKGKTSEAIRKLLNLQPRTAVVLKDAGETEIAVEDVVPGDVVVVKPGEKIPVDGVVTEGESYVDESMISGEPLPVLKKRGHSIIAGTINKNSRLVFRAEKVGRDTVLAQIIKMVEDAQGSKPPVQGIADRVVSWFIPFVLSVAVLAFFVWFFIAGESLLFSLTVLISILVIACPCALGLATPTAVTVGIGRGAELGILIRSGESLEVSEKLTTILLDKTGTLTRGRPEVTDIIVIETDESELVRIAASVERNASHPLADALERKAREMGIFDLHGTDAFDTLEGKGVQAVIKGKTVLIGNRTLLEEAGVPLPLHQGEAVDSLEKEAKTVVFVVFDGCLIGILAIADPLKETSTVAVKAFKDMGLRVAMITGDNRRTAGAIAGRIGIDNVIAEVLPQSKADEVKRLRQADEIVGFIGDGINDAPALASADVGIAIGSGTDIAIESGDIVLMRDDLLDAAAAIQLSRKVMTRIRQNLFWAFAYNSALIPLAAGVFYPFWGLTMKPELAGLAMAMSSVTIVMLSLRLKSFVPSFQRK